MEPKEESKEKVDLMDKLHAYLEKNFVALIGQTVEISIDELENPQFVPAPGPNPPTYQVPAALAGFWTNELGSQLYIHSTGFSEGHIIGKCYSTVGKAGFKLYDLNGSYDTNGDEKKGTLGWTVQCLNTEGTDSNKSWSGQRYKIEGDFFIYTMWILVAKKDLSDNWGSTQIGKDKFHKVR
ncbi:PREDICTED: uncharacterized protein LOC109583134 isoform X1 [Amphimedon queenslandica]|uniref:Uncharacterized protein n=1 Tax=Amphimedon queenslandica TaxID=400682 RepID=A0AAN0JAA8_AMPQE|nr:PREDICTED: uncharacterized protein LOC109583134 isoform X1 [Amphimedon queenslandica]|eukprot:XP_019853899.1 PREDICTED: uncharacterized protein LOC109583134 isoform X1 [Amphimedon queenslandica]